MKAIRSRVLCHASLSLVLSVPASVVAQVQSPVIDKSRLLSKGEVHGGLVVHLGCSKETLLAAFAMDSRFVAQGLARDEGVVRKLRSSLETKRLYGKTSVTLLDAEKLPYNDLLVRYLIVEDPLRLALPKETFSFEYS